VPTAVRAEILTEVSDSASTDCRYYRMFADEATLEPRITALIKIVELVLNIRFPIIKSLFSVDCTFQKLNQ